MFSERGCSGFLGPSLSGFMDGSFSFPGPVAQVFWRPPVFRTRCSSSWTCRPSSHLLMLRETQLRKQYRSGRCIRRARCSSRQPCHHAVWRYSQAWILSDERGSDFRSIAQPALQIDSWSLILQWLLLARTGWPRRAFCVGYATTLPAFQSAIHIPADAVFVVRKGISADFIAHSVQASYVNEPSPLPSVSPWRGRS